ncbi:MAG TPA: fused MFS/spermidine synthase [Terracidiphilus sp.]|nr:fused MFS/spermidine synthase [Terracidiphilus sp.]
MCANVSTRALAQDASTTAEQALPKAWIYYLLFFLSGFPALLYQIVWQRALFTLFGVNVESVTLVVTVFMLGLGLGSLAGGALSSRPGIRLLAAFGAVELCIGGFGAASLQIFHGAASYTAGKSLLTTGMVAFALLLVPTLLMGSTLPLLSEHFVRRTGNVGESVGLLYAVNTLGSGLACLMAAYFLMRLLGESGTVRLAVGFNIAVGATALILQRGRAAPASRSDSPAETIEPQRTIPLWVGMILAGATGFIALAYEIIWYRLYSFASGSTAQCFAEVLAFYLFGIAYGSRAVRSACQTKLGNDIRRTMAAGAEVIVLGGIAAYLVGPALMMWEIYSPTIPFVGVFVAATLLGAAFPLLAHASIDPAQRVGKGVSFLYFSNIIGSTMGSFLIGFVVMDHWSTQATSVFLLGLGLVVALVFASYSGRKTRRAVFAVECAVCAVLAASSHPLFSSMYERLLFKTDYKPGMRFSALVENRSGVISVYNGKFGSDYPTETVFGGGAYDGRFNTGLIRDSNALYRAYAVMALAMAPRHVLMIGLSSGSWAQVIANDPRVVDFTVVEINPGYLPLIATHPEVASLLHNPKVSIVIDDGRRWLVANKDRRFDLIVMNTTYNWRANNTNLLSKEFLRLAHSHLNPGGIFYYNTTSSRAVFATGISEFPYALRVANFLALSDGQLRLENEGWRNLLSTYEIDGKPVFNLAEPAQAAALDRVAQLADQLDTPGGNLESKPSLTQRTRGARLITDDNMGTEWEPPNFDNLP